MGFVAISIDNYVKIHLENNPSENEKNLRKRLNSAVEDYKNGAKCACGNEIWVIGSASVGNSCFTCITGESMPIDDYEINSVIYKQEEGKGRRHIDKIKPEEIHGFFDDDGFEINNALIMKPSKCLTCQLDNDPKEELFCNMIRFDQRHEQEFNCFAYKKLD